MQTDLSWSCSPVHEDTRQSIAQVIWTSILQRRLNGRLPMPFPTPRTSKPLLTPTTRPRPCMSQLAKPTAPNLEHPSWVLWVEGLEDRWSVSTLLHHRRGLRNTDNNLAMQDSSIGGWKTYPRRCTSDYCREVLFRSFSSQKTMLRVQQPVSVQIQKTRGHYSTNRADPSSTAANWMLQTILILPNATRLLNRRRNAIRNTNRVILHDSICESYSASQAVVR